MPMFLSGANFQQARLNCKNSDYGAGYLNSADLGSRVPGENERIGKLWVHCRQGDSLSRPK
jgi:hypothetical protein